MYYLKFLRKLLALCLAFYFGVSVAYSQNHREKQKIGQSKSESGGQQVLEVFTLFSEIDINQNSILEPEECNSRRFQRIYARLLKYDNNNDGFISISELQHGLKLKLRRLSEKIVQKLFDKIEKLVIQGYKIEQLGSEFDWVLPSREFLYNFDKNQNQKIDMDELEVLKPFIKVLLFKQRIERLTQLVNERLERIREKRIHFLGTLMDTNLDGLVDKNEWENLIKFCLGDDFLDYYYEKIPLQIKHTTNNNSKTATEIGTSNSSVQVSGQSETKTQNGFTSTRQQTLSYERKSGDPQHFKENKLYKNNEIYIVPKAVDSWKDSIEQKDPLTRLGIYEEAEEILW